MPKQAEAKPAGTGLDIGAVTQNSQRSLAAIAHLHSRAFRDALKLNAELLDFTRRRLGANIDASDRLANCGTATEAVSVMTSFYQGAVQDYARESSALWRIGTEMAKQSAREAIDEATRGGDKG